MRGIGLVLLFALILLFLGLSISHKEYGDSGEAVLVSARPDTRSYGGSVQRAVHKRLYIEEARRWMKSTRVARMVNSSSGEDGVVFYRYGKFKNISASAPGVDGKHRIVNSYLVGYRPFKARNIWIPWQVIARKKTYQTDQLFLEDGRAEVWQTSRQAHKYTSGDCEDHAIALADWLISMGKDARVVLGSQNGGGHAWVVLFAKGREFLLEATRKTAVKQMTKFPLAKFQRGYYPSYMFNRTQFWKNTGSQATTRYASSAWVQKSKYK